ncbi:hypothetical protein VSR34_33880, partial [Paraburkholderia sp. JHI2823]|uniref:hypothetical protein n=1 Tax=Paraburkholderia sp. JHI2823 TaxID=3112960 RepID=UPI0031761CDD
RLRTLPMPGGNVARGVFFVWPMLFVIQDRTQILTRHLGATEPPFLVINTRSASMLGRANGSDVGPSIAEISRLVSANSASDALTLPILVGDKSNLDISDEITFVVSKLPTSPG